jgi:hypothetical protein
MQEETLSGYLPVIPAIIGELDQGLEILLKEHGCTIEVDDKRYIVTYPPGTIKQQIFPRVHECRYRLTLPDNFEIREIESHTGKISVFAVVG